MQRDRKAAAAATLALALGLALPAAAQNDGPVTTRREPTPAETAAMPAPTTVRGGPNYAAFPEKNPRAVADWILTNIDIDKLTLITSGPTMTVWILPDRIDRANAPRVGFWERGEVTSAEVEAEAGGRSLMVQKEIDCQRKLVRTIFTAIYKGNNLTDYARSIGGEPKVEAITDSMHETLEMAKVC